MCVCVCVCVCVCGAGGICEFGVLHPSLCEVSVTPPQRSISAGLRATTPGSGSEREGGRAIERGGEGQREGGEREREGERERVKSEILPELCSVWYNIHTCHSCN